MIVVTAPTSTIGRQLVARLLEHDEPVRVVVRDPSKLPDAVRERVEVVVGSHRDRGVLDAALPGADALFWLMPADHSAPDIFDTYVTASIAGAEAVHRHGVERVVIVSALGRGSGLYAGPRVGVARDGGSVPLDRACTCGRWRTRRSWTTCCASCRRCGRAS